MKKKEYSLDIAGKPLLATFSDLAEQADGSVMLRYGDTVILATAVMSAKEKSGVDYLPLSVEYEERFYASGQILGSRFLRREGRPSDEAILSGRVVDRTIRPLFNNHIRNEIQVVITVLSLGVYDPDVLGVIGASLALGMSDIPWNGPVNAIRIGKKKGDERLEINPTYIFREEIGYEADLTICGKDGLVNMIEVGGLEVSEKIISDGMKKAIEEIEKIQMWQKQIISEIGKPKKVLALKEVTGTIKKLFAEQITPKLFDSVFAGAGKEKMYELKNEWLVLAKESLPEENTFLSDEHFENEVNDLLHKEAIENNKRPDGREMDELRPLFAQAGGISPILHGSGIFYRGGTHILSALTLGGPGASQVIDGMETQTKKRFMHHYNFPPFSVGETGRIGGLNRRMTGHGALAEKALLPVIPPKETFPYTIRIVSEAFASNGSTSMASVCGSSLALMDAGVPITRPVAGIASGLMMATPKKYKVLTDIQGPEDHHGDMDFKVAGTREGITAIQMDVKVAGVTVEILEEALQKARAARLTILETIEKEIDKPRADISPNAPKIIVLKIKPDQIGLVIGTGGKVINGIKEDTGVEAIDIEDDGTVFITGKNGTAEKAKQIIEEMTHEYKIGERLTGTVVKIADFGAFVSLNSNTDGMVHISEIAPFRIDRVEAYLKAGDKVPVVVKEIDAERGRLKLSIKDADPSFIKRKSA